VTVRLAAVTVDCADALVVAPVLGRRTRPAPRSPVVERVRLDRHAQHRDTRGWRLEGDPTWLFAKVPEGKVAKIRMHVDMAAADPQAGVTRLVELGATRVADMNEWGYQWTVMQDPEGNEFCVAQTR
jgi:Glyoxalase-like domain